MISYNVPINAQRMTIGVQGENNVREFLFDVTDWRQLTGDIGTAEMVIQRRGDSSPYAAAITMHDENTVSWIPVSADTAKAGAGKIQLMWIANGQTVKTKIFDMKVDPALDYQLPDDSLDPWASWMPDVINAAAAMGDLPGTVADAAADWLEENIGPTTPAVDASLSVSGAAADAKVAGEKVTELKSALNGDVDYTLELGNINMSASGWNYYTSTTRVRVKQGETVPLEKGAVIGLYDYSNYHMYVGWLVNGTYKQQGWLVSDFIAPEDADYTILVTKTPETEITVDEVKRQLFVFAYGHPLSNAYYGDWLASKAVYDHAVTIPVEGFQYGNIETDGSDGTTNTVNRARSTFIKVPKGTYVGANTIYVFEYDEDKAFRMNSGGFVNGYTVTDDGYVRVCQFVSNGNVRSVTITYPVQIPSAYVSDYNKPEAVKWKNEWFFDGAHRGSNRYIAPDTLPAYVNAKAEGYNSIEGDIRVTSDGHYVIHHDDGMPSSSSYLISTHTLAELRANANMGYFNGEALPILDLKEWLLLAKNLDMFVFAEFKATLTSGQIIECMTIARDCGMQDRVAWMAELSNASVFRGFYPLCHLAIINTLDYSSASQYVLAQHPERTVLYTGTTNITDALVANCTSVGLGVVGWCIAYSWMFGDDWTEDQVKTEIKRALACGARGMVLDYWTVADIYQETYSAYLLNT